jgi:predicted enzyme related to lactoylglutathione lyase
MRRDQPSQIGFDQARLPASSVTVKGARRVLLTTKLDLFAGIPVADYAAARQWYEQLLGSPPTFIPHDTEAVWELAEHRYMYIVQKPEHAGHAMHTLFVDDLDALLAQIADRGLEPMNSETYSNGVRKMTFRDPDGNEIGFGGAPR